MTKTIYSATKNGQTVQRTSDRDYTYGVIAVFPDGLVKMISCHATQAQARAASLKTDGTAARWSATREGAKFEVVELLANED